MIFIIKGFWTIVFIFIVTIKMKTLVQKPLIIKILSMFKYSTGFKKSSPFKSHFQ